MQREFITFVVGGQTFGLDIMSIREIRAWTPTTKLPRVPNYVAGVVNLRGTVLPVIELATRLGWQGSEPTPRHAIIVTQFHGQARGMIVDSVSDIITLNSDALQLPPTTSSDGVVPFLEGLAALDDQMIMILDLEKLSADELQSEAA